MVPNVFGYRESSNSSVSVIGAPILNNYVVIRPSGGLIAIATKDRRPVLRSDGDSLSAGFRSSEMLLDLICSLCACTCSLGISKVRL